VEKSGLKGGWNHPIIVIEIARQNGDVPDFGHRYYHACKHTPIIRISFPESMENS
jgi:hypothetical protein